MDMRSRPAAPAIVLLLVIVFLLMMVSPSLSQIEDASMWLDKTSFAPGETIIVHFTAPATFKNDAWIGLVPTDVPHDSEPANEKNTLERHSLNGMKAGTLVFTAPAKPAIYDFRMHDADTGAEEIGSMSFYVR